MQPYLMKQLIEFYEQQDAGDNQQFQRAEFRFLLEGVPIGLAMFLCALIQSLVNRLIYFLISRTIVFSLLF
jgi:hypothetical protein